MTKQELRKTYLEKRSRISQKILDEHSLTLCDELMYVLNGKNVSWVHCFLTMPGQSEVKTSPIFESLWLKKINTVVPVSNFANNSMCSSVYQTGTPLENSKFGIPEPVEPKFIDEKLIDCVITPLIVADKRGYRVGYGKGFYDRFFEKLRPDVLKIGVCFFEPVEEIENIDQYDKPLDILITPKQIRIFGPFGSITQDNY